MRRINLFTVLCISLCVVLLDACKSSVADSTDKKEESSALKALPKSMIDKMYAEVDYIDYLWHDLPFSLSQEEKESINTNISFISDEAVPVIPEGCKAIGRKVYNIKGNTYLTADVYFTPSCQFYVFLEGEKPIYASKMTAQGVTFYTQVIESQTSKGGQ